MAQQITRADVDNVNIKYIPNTNELYAAGRNGNIYSFTWQKQGKELKTGSRRVGYIMVGLKRADTGKFTMAYVHRIIAELFVENPNPEEFKYINHINEDIFDNRAENLEWCTQKYNCNFGSHSQKLSEAIRNFYKNRSFYGKKCIPVAICDLDGNLLTVAGSIAAAAHFINNEKYQSKAVQISKILATKKYHHTVGGYKVRVATEQEYEEHLHDIPMPQRRSRVVRPTTEVVENINTSNESVKKAIKDKKSVVVENINTSNESVKKAIKDKKSVKVVATIKRIDQKTGMVVTEEREYKKGDKYSLELW